MEGIRYDLKRGVCGVQAAALFAKLYFLPTIRNEAPADVRLEPTW